MNTLTYENQRTLLSNLAYMGSKGRAEGESRDRFPQTFHPVAEHARAFDPDVVLVIGPRGAGKSELFRAVIELRLLPAISRHAQSLRLPSGDPTRTVWVAAYPVGANFPDARGLARFLKEQSEPDALIELWFTYLVRALWEHIDAQGKAALDALSQCQGGDALANVEAFRAANDAPLLALDRLDAALERDDRRIFVGYDELDTLGGANWETMNQSIRGLVGFWAGYTRRWKRIRAKVFLRTDLYQRVGATGGADLAKLAANRAEITWNDRNLYAMLVKRAANYSPQLLDYCRNASIEFESDPDLGEIPSIMQANDARSFVERIVGLYMGAGVKKGLTYRWLLEHIRDGRGHALPRPLVRLIEHASELQLNSSKHARWPKLLVPISLRRALDTVSEEHVQQSLSEWPWLTGLAKLLKGEQVPWTSNEIEHVLDRGWDAVWSGKNVAMPPADKPRNFVDYLVEVGIFRARSDGRLDVPDLFLAGLGLKRKGGVRRR
jgi:hypothetical protein